MEMLIGPTGMETRKPLAKPVNCGHDVMKKSRAWDYGDRLFFVVLLFDFRERFSRQARAMKTVNENKR